MSFHILFERPLRKERKVPIPKPCWIGRPDPTSGAVPSPDWGELLVGSIRSLRPTFSISSLAGHLETCLGSTH